MLLMLRLKERKAPRKNKYPSKPPHPYARLMEPGGSEIHYRSFLDQFNLNTQMEFDHSLYAVLSNLAEGIRLNGAMREWLLRKSTSALINDSVIHAFHEVEARYYLEKFKESHDPVYAISAADEFNQAAQYEVSVSILNEYSHIKQNSNAKIGAFYLLTLGTSLYELGLYVDAREATLESYRKSKEEIATCLLLGKVCLHLTDVYQSIFWFTEAENNGCGRKECDDVMRQALKSVKFTQRHAVVRQLFDIDAERYRFARAVLPKKRRSALT